MAFNAIQKLYGGHFQEIIGWADESIPSGIDRIFTRGKMDGPIEDIATLEAPSMPQSWTPGDAHEELSMGMSFDLRTVLARFGGKISIPMHLIKEDPTHTMSRMMSTKSAMLVSAFMDFRELMAGAYLASMFTDGTGLATLDGVSGFSESHPISEAISTTYSNRLADDPQLNPSSLQAGISLFSAMYKTNGWQLLKQKASYLLANDTNYMDVQMTLKAPMDAFSYAPNRVNTSLDYNIQPVYWGYFKPTPSADYADVAAYPAWILFTGKQGLNFKTLNGFETWTKVDEDTGMLTLGLNDDFAMSCTDPRTMVGSAP